MHTPILFGHDCDNVPTIYEADAMTVVCAGISEEHGESIVRAVNNHDALVAALEALLTAYQGLRELTERDRDTNLTNEIRAVLAAARA